MNNYGVARVFSGIADLMDLRGDNPFKVRAYRNAAQTMQELTERLEVLAERGELREIPGVGEAIAAKTRDILATGTTALYDELRAEIPESLAELLALPGFGVKKAQLVWRELAIADLPGLEQAAQTGRLRTLSGFTARTESSLVEAIAAHRARRLRTPIGVALPFADRLLAHLRGLGPLSRVEIAGSLRRRADTVGDLDFVAAARDPSAAAAACAGLEDLEQFRVAEPGRIEARVGPGLPVEIRLVEPSQFGPALLLATGSQGHLSRLQARAAERGLDLMSLAGCPEREPVSEAEVYAALGLPWIPPELREDRGELEAAEADRLPALIEERDIRGILHAHSTWSDGLASIADMAAAAGRCGFRFHGNTDHSKVLGVARGLDEARLLTQLEEIEALNRTLPEGPRILSGIECDILADGELDLPLDLLERLDVVVASVHLHQTQDRETMTARVVRALRSGVVDILGHPTGRLLGARDPFPLEFDAVLDAAVEHQVALEINASPERLDLNDVMARQAAQRGLRLSINTDAHRPDALGMLRFGIGQARRAWLEPGDVLNTWELEPLLDWLHRRPRPGRA
jgi:DNA polymerase (family 10)